MTGGGRYLHQFLDSKRLEADATADDFIRSNFNAPETKSVLYYWLEQLTGNHSLQTIPAPYQQEVFIVNYRSLPVWADKKQMLAGSAFFTKHARQIMQLLGLLSLPYCYAAADGAMVLYFSERLKNDAGKDCWKLQNLYGM